MKDYVIRAIDEKKTMRVFVATTTNTVNEATKIHSLSPVAAAALGRTLTAVSMMGQMMKGEKDTISMQLLGDGPIGNVFAMSNSFGEVKGYVGNPLVDLPLKHDNKLDVGGAVGKNGRIVVIKDLGLKDPYVGQSNLVSGEVAEDLANYYLYSEQQPSAVNLGVLVDTDLSIKASGGYIVQLLPDVLEEDIDLLENNIKNAESISSLIDRGYTPEDILKEIFGVFNMEILEKSEVLYKCDCSRERMEEALISLGKEEINKIIEEDGKAEVVCHFCNKKHQFSKEDLKSLI
ncbi:Hsp33 family molecular chaperone HslO [Anaerosalibacter sp. Marseille-P3206]|uniref:Hsp33 family molecular chaperone HslO n=1 Tax=Anaerosalibacter sp. Marseille-P3206 TaxID=1871005 RepID=UPI0009844979|nr:Hsp33 family molecular chaperone HslO [Anaerosalibacter sp. Marseille-P3206]